ncbi:TPA: S1 RNA-binding domain-containing protein, partial [Campylobacter upsaliensis]|nr:S1 RNA-binding domain-containing protein [Campylobacter upsaliensis]
DNQKISLSTKELKNSPVQEYAKTHKVGDVVKGMIRDIKDFGIFVELSENVDALIHKEDISSAMLETLKIDDEIEAAIAFIDEKKNRIRLSVKNLLKLKEREVLNEINGDDKMTLGDIIKEQLS